MNSPEDIEHFLVLHKKSDVELRSILEGMQMPTEGKRDDLIKRLLTLKIEKQNDIDAPQVIPLRTRNEAGEHITGALELLQRARGVIYNGKNNSKEFELLNSDGKLYKMTMRFARLSQETLNQILENGFYYPHSAQKELILALRSAPDKFVLHIVSKPSTKGSEFIMIHCQRKVA